jgi:pimeloyl-ACP methyl ester carboxylesterase
VGSIVEKEIDATPERYVALRVTPVSGEPSLGQPIYRYISNKAAAFARTPASGAVLGKLREELERLMGPRFDAVAFAPMETYSQRLSTFSISRIEFTSEPGIRIPALLYQPSPSSGSCVIYASGDVTAVGGVFDGDDDASGGQEPDNPLSPFARKMVERGVTVLAVDVRGIGLTSPAASRRDYRGKYEHLHNSDVALANMAWSLGESLIAMRVKDLLRAIEFGSQFGKVHLAGVDMGAIWAIFAGALDSRVASVSVQGVLASFRMLAERARFLHSPSQFVPGLLKWMDLPQIAGLIAPRPLAILNVLNQEKELLELGTARKAFEWTSEVYRSLGAERSLTIAASRELSDFVKL